LFEDHYPATPSLLERARNLAARLFDRPETTMPKERLTHCPETGRNLDGVDIRAHVDNLWPALDARDPRFVEARRRRDLLLAEAARRDADAPTKP